jgi:hypothetical protein
VGGRLDAAIAETLPGSESAWRRKLFAFARRLKALPHLSGADAEALMPVVDRWHAAAGAALRRVPLPTIRAAFAVGWARVKFPAGGGPLDRLTSTALALAPSSHIGSGRRGPGFAALAVLCRLLDQESGGRGFFLSCRKAGELLGVDFKTASRWLKALCDSGVLRLAVPGSYASARAHRYRLADAPWPEAGDRPAQEERRDPSERSDGVPTARGARCRRVARERPPGARPSSRPPRNQSRHMPAASPPRAQLAKSARFPLRGQGAAA